MIVRRLDECRGERTVAGETWTSHRLLLAEDGMGFSMHDTTIAEGTVTRMHYQNHLEAVYCIEGRGRVELAKSGEVLPISAGTVYALDENDKHVLIAETEMRMVCVFNPALVGPETHDDTGAYPPPSVFESASAAG